MAAAPVAAQRPAAPAVAPTTAPATRPTTNAATQPARPGLGAEFTSLADFRNFARAEGKRVEFPVENGILLLDVAPKGSAATAGLQVGDIVTRIGGKPVATIAEIVARVDDARIGSKVPVDFLRVQENGQWEAAKVAMPVMPGQTDFEKQMKAGVEALSAAPVGLFVLSAGDLPGEPRAKQLADLLRTAGQGTVAVDYRCRNNTAKPVRAFRGLVILTDRSGKAITETHLTHNASNAARAMAPGDEDGGRARLLFNRVGAIGPAMQDADLADMKIRFEPEEVFYADGSKETFKKE